MVSARTAIGIVGLGAGLVSGGRSIIRHRRTLELNGRVVLITGGSRGLGLAMALECARRGSRIAICARDERNLGEAASMIEREGAEVLAIPCNVADQHAVADMIERVIEHYGRIDILINNAGTIMIGPAEVQTLDDFRECMDVMFWGVLYTTLAVLPSMRERHFGRIVNITSIGGKVPVPYLLPYDSAKHAATGLSEGLRVELAKEGVLVTTVVPGLMRTGSYMNALYKGRNRVEYSAFSIFANLPLVTMDAARAAAQIIEAARHGDAHLTISWPAQVLSKANGVAPGLTSGVLALVSRVLPGPGATGNKRHLGHESRTPISESMLTALGQQAAERYNQLPDDAREKP